MAIKILSGALSDALGRAELPLSEKQAKRIPILTAVKLVASGNRLTVTSTRFDATIVTTVEATGEGEVAVPFERLAALAGHFPADAELTIGCDGTIATVASGRSRFKLPVFPLSDMLERHILGEETGCVELDAKAARDLFARPAFAASSEATRYYLNGIFLHSVGDDLVAAATDGYRLCRVATPATTTLSTDRTLIVPNEMVKAVNRLIGRATGSVTLRRSERLFSVESTEFALVARMVDATFPDYERLTSFTAPNVATVSRASLRESLARFAAVADREARTHAVRLRWNGDGLQLSAPDGSVDLLAADVEGKAETAAQVRYLVELMGALRGDSVRLSTGGSGDMILVSDPDDQTFTALQMTMVLSSVSAPAAEAAE
jgi:DNA polymerase III subunit beta